MTEVEYCRLIESQEYQVALLVKEDFRNCSSSLGMSNKRSHPLAVVTNEAMDSETIWFVIDNKLMLHLHTPFTR